MTTNTRVKIDSRLLFERFIVTKQNLRDLAIRTKLSVRTIENMLRDADAPARGFYSEGVEALCTALGKDSAVVITARLPRKGRVVPIATNGTATQGLSLASAVPAFERRTVRVAACASLHEPCNEVDLITLQPGATIEFAGYDPASRWTHEPAACVEQWMFQRAFVHPDSASPKLLTTDEIKLACQALDDMFHQAAVAWLRSFGLPHLQVIAERGLPTADLISRAAEALQTMQRPAEPWWAEIPNYIAKLKDQLRSSRRPINIRLRPGDRSRAGIALWKSVLLNRHIERIQAGERDAWKAVGPWFGPAGETNAPAGADLPVLNAAPGACILYAGRLDESRRLTPTAAVRFAAAGDCFTNTSELVVLCRLACNDAFPGDNLGHLDIDITIHPKPAEPAS